MAGQDRDGFLSSISSQALIGRGAAGNIALTTGRLILTDGAQIDGSTQANGRGGNIAIRGQQIDLSKRGTISARSAGKGDAGNIRIQADETFHNQNGAVTTTAEQSGGGQIELRAGRLVHLRDSEVTTSVQGGGGDAGNLTVDAPFIVAGGSQLVAKAFGGRGGNIRINAEVFLADPASRVDASSTLGISGTVDIQAPVTNLSGLVTPLPPEFAPATALLRDRCAARLREGAVSSFVERGRDGVPATPEGVLPSRLSSGSAGMASPTSETAVSRPGWSPSGRQRACAGPAAASARTAPR